MRTGSSRSRYRSRPRTRRGGSRSKRASSSEHPHPVDRRRGRAGHRPDAPARGAARAAAPRHRPLPRDAHAARDRAGALDPARERRAGRQPNARDGREQRPRAGGAGPGRRLPRGRGRGGVADAQGAGRHAADPGARRAAGRAQGVHVPTEPYMVARIEEAPDIIEPSPELEALHRNVQTTFSRIIEEVPYLPEELQIAVANLDDPSELANMIAGALRLKTEEKQKLLEERTCRQAPADALGDPRARARAGGDRDPHPVPGAVRDGRGPARVLAAPAAQGDPGGARRGRRGAGRGRGAARAARGGRACPSTPASRPSASCSASSAFPPQSVEHGRDPHLPRVDRHAAVVALQRGHPRPGGRAQARWTRTTTTSSR